MQVYPNVPSIVKAMKGQSHGQGGAIKRWKRVVWCQQLQSQGQVKQAMRSSKCTFPSQICFFSEIQRRWFRRHLQRARWQAFWNSGAWHPCSRLCHLLHRHRRAEHKVHTLPCSVPRISSPAQGVGHGRGGIDGERGGRGDAEKEGEKAGGCLSRHFSNLLRRENWEN